jgi:hypothetical protein
MRSERHVGDQVPGEELLAIVGIQAREPSPAFVRRMSPPSAFDETWTSLVLMPVPAKRSALGTARCSARGLVKTKRRPRYVVEETI